MSDTPPGVPDEHSQERMASSSRDRISVDLRGLKAALIARALALSVSPSSFVRSTLATALGPNGEPANEAAPRVDPLERVRVSLRMRGDDAQRVRQAAQTAGLSAGDLVAALVNGMPARSAGEPGALVAALTQSCDELAVLSRSLRHLTALLREGSTRAAQEYRSMLDAVDVDVRAHLALSSSVVSHVRPLIRHQLRDTSPFT